MSAWKYRRHSGFPDRHSPELLPAVIVIVLLAAVGLQLALPWEQPLPDGTQLAPRRAPTPSDPVAKHYAGILRAPIFAPDRAPVEDTQDSAGGLNGYTVLGIAVAGDTAAALIGGPDGTTLRVLKDSNLGGWQLTGVDRTRLTFERNGEQRVLTLDKKPPVASSSTAAQPDTDEVQDSAGDNSGDAQ